MNWGLVGFFVSVFVVFFVLFLLLGLSAQSTTTVKYYETPKTQACR